MNDPRLTAWYVGLALGTVAILVTVVLVVMILGLARTLGAKSREIASTLHQVRLNTDTLSAVALINVDTDEINQLLGRLRSGFDRIYPGGSR